MRFTSKSLAGVIALLVVFAAVATAGDETWFDNKNCTMCKNMSSALMESVSWEQHSIKNGIVSVTTVPEKHMKEYREAHHAMTETSKRLQKGEMLPLCGSCTALGMCMMKGVNQEYVKTTHGDVWILTSDNAEVVAELQAWAKRNREEMEKMEG